MAGVSSEAVAWAFKQTVKPSGAKFTLVALCECANYKTGRITPSIAHLVEITGQNRKTIITHIDQLERAGFIRDTGERSGKTKQIKVYNVEIETVPKAEQSQKRNSSDNDGKQSQNRDTEPSWEPSGNGLSDDKPTRAYRAKGWPEIPGWMPAEAWNGYIAMRKKNRKFPTDRAVKLMIGQLERWLAQGYDLAEILDNSTLGDWTGLFEPKAKPNGRQPQPTGHRNPVAAALDKRIGLVEPAGAPERRAVGGGGGDQPRALAGPARL